MNRIFIQDGDGANKPPKLEERLQVAVNMWQVGKKGEAFAMSLNAIAYLSAGLAGMAKLVGDLESRVKAMEGKNDQGKNPDA